jgi:metal-responsive CopG/Arc/MetJ family transcriptional regulator
MAVYVPLIVAERKQRYKVMLDPSLVQGIDLAAKAAGVSRSDFIAYAATQSLEDKTGAVTVARGRARARHASKGARVRKAGKRA